MTKEEEAEFLEFINDLYFQSQQTEYQRGYNQCLSDMRDAIQCLSEQGEQQVIKIEIPYMTILSKNQSHRNIAINKRVPTKAYTEALKGIGYLIKGQMRKGKVSFIKDKVWLDIMIYRPNMRGDPINFIDGLADGIKGALGIDDKYYSVTLDWVLDKKNPRITIEMRQG